MVMTLPGKVVKKKLTSLDDPYLINPGETVELYGMSYTNHGTNSVNISTMLETTVENTYFEGMVKYTNTTLLSTPSLKFRQISKLVDNQVVNINSPSNLLGSINRIVYVGTANADVVQDYLTNYKFLVVKLGLQTANGDTVASGNIIVPCVSINFFFGESTIGAGYNGNGYNVEVPIIRSSTSMTSTVSIGCCQLILGMSTCCVIVPRSILNNISFLSNQSDIDYSDSSITKLSLDIDLVGI